MFGRKKYVPKSAFDFKESKAMRQAANVARKKGVSAAYDEYGNVVLTTLRGERSPSYDALLTAMDPNEALRFLANDVGAAVGAHADLRARKNQW